MKKILLSAIGLFIILTSKAQISLTLANIASQGDVVIDANVNLQGPTPAGGANQTYNLLNSTATGGDDTTYYVNPASTPFASTIDSSNLVSISGGGYVFYEKDASGLYLRGTVFTTAGLPIRLPFAFAPLRFKKRIPVLKFPATIGMNLIEKTSSQLTFRYDTTIAIGPIRAVVDSVRIIADIVDTSKIDGFGEAQFTGGNFNCLRNIQILILTFKAEIRSSIFGGPPVWNPFPIDVDPVYTQQLLLWANESKAPIVTLAYNPNGSLLRTSIQKNFLTSNRPLMSTKAEFEYTPYPNPVVDILNLRSEKSLKTLRLFSTNGKLVREFSLDAGQTNIEIGQLGNGIYWAEAVSHLGLISRKKLIINK